jgi:tRNA G18 (ribose-2'-O)-methylase SpoU
MALSEFFLAIETFRHQNIGTLIRLATAFGATNIIIVGSNIGQ